MEMTTDEIVRDYNAAKNKKEQIGILADLNECKTADVLDILTEAGAIGGFTPPKAAAAKKKAAAVRTAWTEEDDNRLTELYRSGLPWASIADRLGRTPKSVKMRWERLGLSKYYAAERKTAAGEMFSQAAATTEPIDEPIDEPTESVIYAADDVPLPFAADYEIDYRALWRDALGNAVMNVLADCGEDATIQQVLLIAAQSFTAAIL